MTSFEAIGIAVECQEGWVLERSGQNEVNDGKYNVLECLIDD